MLCFRSQIHYENLKFEKNGTIRKKGGIIKKIKNNYTNFILKIIAVGIVGLNYHLFSGDIISSAEASHSMYGMNYGGRVLHVYIDNWPSN